MAHKVIVPQKKIMSHSFLNSGTLIVIISCNNRKMTQHQIPSKLPYIQQKKDFLKFFGFCSFSHIFEYFYLFPTHTVISFTVQEARDTWYFRSLQPSTEQRLGRVIWTFNRLLYASCVKSRALSCFGTTLVSRQIPRQGDIGTSVIHMTRSTFFVM